MSASARKDDPDYLPPNAGGCWFCYRKDVDAFDWEFDTYLHIACLREELERLGDSDEPSEARIMAYLLDEGGA